MAIGPVIGGAVSLSRSIFFIVILLSVLVGILLYHGHAEGHVGIPALYSTRIHGLQISLSLQPRYLLVHFLGVLADLRELDLHEPETEGDEPTEDYNGIIN